MATITRLASSANQSAFSAEPRLNARPPRVCRGVHRIVSGGQTGVDRGALNAAIALGVPHGGWCPAGRIAEDGRIPDRYRLVEHASADYAHRTEQNVIDSDGTLILNRGRLKGGTQLTVHLAKRHARPLYRVNLEQPPSLQDVRRWLVEADVGVLNVAGPRESSQPGIEKAAEFFVRQLLGDR